MKISLIPNLFKKPLKSLKLPESIILKELKAVTQENNLLTYENITIYHHSRSILIPLMILDTTRGIYLFEYKDWSYDELKTATIEKASQQNQSQKTLAFQKSHSFIEQKYNEMTHNDCVPIFNFLLMQNLNNNEYEHLDDSFKKLLPQERILFNDLSKDEILQKMKNIPKSFHPMPQITDIIGNILVQYAIKDNNDATYIVTTEQQNFIDLPFASFEVLSAPTGSGKTSAFLLKMIFQKIKNPELKIIIIKPTVLSCDLLRKKLLGIIDNAFIEFDITSIEIITPAELTSRHLKSCNKDTLQDEIKINNILMRKDFYASDVIICDDSDLLTNDFKNYLKHLQRNASLLLIRSAKPLNETYTFTKNFAKEHKKVFFEHANPHAKALQIIASLLEFHMPRDILVVSSTLSKEKLNDDLEYFIRDKAVLLDSSKKLIDQDIDNLLLCGYSDINSLDAKFVILMDICFASSVELEYAYNICSDSVYVLYEDECEKLASLRSDFEDNKE